MLPYHATNKKKACISHGILLVTAGANRKKARVRIFCKKLFMQLHWFICFSSFFILQHNQQLPLKMLALINHSCLKLLIRIVATPVFVDIVGFL